ncbi:phenylacetyl-CoA ligase [Pleurotus eryngii]|uniref:Phenylacetyl-CoA ligase n=1 Tax=Pleurotus eryngii TaxID=5323 RepID=A0A9P6DLH3_PLEER|nr:phenylacetyl-CoA ligase [Pleurotus eryngii]
MTIFRGPPTPYIPDDLTIPQFILDSHHPTRPVRPHGTPWLIDDVTGTKVGFEELRARSNGLANALKIQYSIGENDVVCVFSSNHVDYPVLVWAAHRLGATVSTANPSYTADELVYQLQISGSTIIFAHPGSLGIAAEAATMAGIPQDRVIVLDSAPGSPYKTVPEMIKFGLRQPVSFVERRLKAGEAKTKLAFLCFSSGTTGKPKAVAISHFAVIANVVQVAVHHAINDPTIPPEEARFAVGGVCTAVLPFFHIYGLIVNLHFALFCAMSIVVIPKFNFTDFLGSVVRYRITDLMIVPPMLVLISKHPAVKNYDLSHVKATWSGAAPLSIELTLQVSKVLTNAIVSQGYGMTETATVVTSMLSSQRLGNGSVGILMPGCAAKVIKQDGTLGGVGELGELVITGPNMALRYHNNEQATKETFVDGWVHTGDEVYFDEKGEMFVVDRLKELIKVRGFQVPPAELEGHLLGHPYVADVAVIPLLDDYSGEIPMAYVVPSTDVAVRVQDHKEAEKVKAEIIKYVADNKVKYKRLDGGVEFIDVIPKSPSGKLLRRILRDKARADRAVRAKL